MRLHNYLVDYQNDDIDNIRHELNQDLNHHVSNLDLDGDIPGVVLNDNRRSRGRISDDERSRRIKGFEVRDKLRNDLMKHNIHRPEKSEWSHSSFNHVTRS